MVLVELSVFWSLREDAIPNASPERGLAGFQKSIPPRKQLDLAEPLFAGQLSCVPAAERIQDGDRLAGRGPAIQCLGLLSHLVHILPKKV